MTPSSLFLKEDVRADKPRFDHFGVVCDVLKGRGKESGCKCVDRLGELGEKERGEQNKGCEKVFFYHVRASGNYFVVTLYCCPEDKMRRTPMTAKNFKN